MSDQNDPKTPVNSPLSDLVGEGKKFKTPDDLAIGKLEADAFIHTLKGENKELRDIVQALSNETKEMKAQVEFLTTVAKGAQSSQPPVTNQSNIQPQAPVNQTKSLTDDDVVRLMEQRDQQTRINNNKAQVRDALVKQFGAESDAFVDQQSAALGITRAELFELAGKSPAAFFNLVGVDPQQSSRNASLTSYVSGKNTANGTDNKPSIRNKAYYDKLKQEMGAVKFILNANIQAQLHRDMRDLGDRWDS